ncbi:MAG: TssQ family T6SS-associated lipoprotein [Sideroxydans sp.]|nr:TssQ family T6SS-associated lipoprotein [Sideroxydans sp.]
MNNNINVVLIALCVLLLGGCASMVSCDDGSQAKWLSSPTARLLSKGVQHYEDGEYAVAMTSFQKLLDTKEASTSEKVEANKYMAFINCISSRDKMCRESFKSALELDPNFNLNPAEAGHPVWGPVFSSVKNKSSK